jgi:RNA polymerase sigma factor (sigma-70 family)
MGATPPAFDERFDALAVIAYRVAYRLLGNRSDAEEVTQEALCRAFAQWSKVADHDEPWVAQVASNIAIGRWRRRRPTVEIAAAGLVSPPPDDAALRRLGLLTALRALPRRQRQVVVLRFLADLPEREVAALLHTSLGAVKQHGHRGLQRLRSELSDSAPLEVTDVR